MDCLSKKNKKKWTVPSLARYREEEEEEEERLIRKQSPELSLLHL